MKINFRILIVLLTILSATVCADAKPSDLPALIQKSKFKGEGLAVLAGYEESNFFANFNSGKKLIPASASKLVTSAAILHHFPPSTMFKTSIWSNAKIEDGVLKGNIWLKGGGDPGFVSENMWYLINIFTRTKITKIEGKVIVDDSLFDTVRFDPSREDIRVDRAYDAPSGAMSFNWNSVNIFVRPGAKAGDPAQVFVDPINGYIRQVSTAVTGPKGGGHTLSVDRKADDAGPGDFLTVKGKIPLDSKEVVIYANITKPDIWSGFNFKSFLSQRGIQVVGGVEAGQVPKDARLLAESDGKEIQNLITDMNKFSNNFVAEMLTKGLAAVSDPPGSIPKGMVYLENYLKGIGIDESQFQLKNPSGLSRENKITAHALWKLLKEMQSQFEYQPEFLISLPIAGVDGTLKNRMKNTPAQGMVRAKTGYLSGVVALAGYAGRKDENAIPFVFIYNGSADESEVRAFLIKWRLL